MMCEGKDRSQAEEKMQRTCGRNAAHVQRPRVADAASAWRKVAR